MQLYMFWYIRSFFGFTFLNILYFFKYSCTNIFHRRSLYTFYWKYNSKLTHCVIYNTHIYMHGIGDFGQHSMDEVVALPWWRHQMETFSALLALCEGNPPVSGGFPSQRSVTRCFCAFFDLCLNKPGWANNRDAGDLRRHRAHYYDVIVMTNVDCISMT